MHENSVVMVAAMTASGLGAASVSDWGKLMDKIIPDDKHSNTLRLITDTKDALFALGNQGGRAALRRHR